VSGKPVCRSAPSACSQVRPLKPTAAGLPRFSAQRQSQAAGEASQLLLQPQQAIVLGIARKQFVPAVTPQRDGCNARAPGG